MSAGSPLDGDSVRALFEELSDRLAAVGVAAQLFVVGGAAMALAYDGARLTRDVDALFVPAPEVRRIAEEMSGPHGLESVPYVLAGLLGLDTAAYSIGYVAGWADGEPDTIRATATRVLSAVHTLAHALTPTPAPAVI